MKLLGSMVVLCLTFWELRLCFWRVFSLGIEVEVDTFFFFFPYFEDDLLSFHLCCFGNEFCFYFYLCFFVCIFFLVTFNFFFPSSLVLCNLMIYLGGVFSLFPILGLNFLGVFFIKLVKFLAAISSLFFLSSPPPVYSFLLGL